MPPRPFRLKPPRLNENDVEAQCMTILQMRSYWVVKLHAGVFKSLDNRRYVHGVPKGTPDYACLHGTHRNFLMEVKRPGGKLSDDQTAQIGVIKQLFQLPVVVVDRVEDLCEFLARHERSP